MNPEISFVGDAESKLDRVMKPDQFTQIIEAILAGKYSWACVLILRFAGYNPLHYIPYRTYNRLVKDNSRSGRKLETHETHKSLTTQTTQKVDQSTAKLPHQISDLAYLEVLNESSSTVRGGYLRHWLTYQISHKLVNHWR